MKKININEENGFSLLEVMISLVILAVGLLGIAMLQITAIRGNASGMKLTEASTLIGSKIEDYRQMVYEDVTDNVEENVKLHENDSRVYTRTTTVTENSPEPGLKTVTVELSWTDTRQHTVSFMTIISNL
ncbi:Prepilin-type cleavage/methylation domain-containing protein [Desulfonema limicola]|uniref:Prepilin-type cleavage/methylation domain-containing protein n=1 Tax=Desulfonema limicola TaxID=45656 RepID=A0A975GJA2_9BACT|nr:prepilin-type N-terminal cleavage/methylation domain-containing protein [Desulfonema limicola]QTA83202.1 Prepilin-type cleavage/methylation domain-containing protein [Desulfonema limicola]